VRISVTLVQVASFTFHASRIKFHASRFTITNHASSAYFLL
jgi:hypothetical protein